MSEMPAPDGRDRLVDDRYWLQSVLGQGGLSRVWQARDEITGQRFAIKEMILEDRDPNQCGTLFRWLEREVHAVAQLRHPGVAEVRDVLMDRDRLWIVMELFVGRFLRKVLDESGPLSPHLAADIGGQVLDALSYAHAFGIVHGDVNPHNILITDYGRVVLTDLGIAAAMTELGSIAGTPCYLAPERRRGDAAVPASDLWGLGATLYAAVEGHPPSPAATVTATAAATPGEPIPRPLRAGPLETVLEGLLAHDPADRMTVATALPLLTAIAGTAADTVGGAVDNPVELYRAYADPLRRYVRRLVTDRGLSEAQVDTDGVVQETFLRLLKATEPIRNPTAWLFVVARNQVDRAAAHQRWFSDGDPADHLHTPTAGWTSLTPQAKSADLNAARAIMDVIARLPGNQRIATYLHHVQGWSLAEIGDYLHCAASTVGVHIHRGTKHIRRDYDEAHLSARVFRDDDEACRYAPGADLRAIWAPSSPVRPPQVPPARPARAGTWHRTGWLVALAALVLSSLLVAVLITGSAAGGQLLTILLVAATVFALAGVALLRRVLRSNRRARRR